MKQLRNHLASALRLHELQTASDDELKWAEKKTEMQGFTGAAPGLNVMHYTSVGPLGRTCVVVMVPMVPSGGRTEPPGESSSLLMTVTSSRCWWERPAVPMPPAGGRSMGGHMSHVARLATCPGGPGLASASWPRASDLSWTRCFSHGAKLSTAAQKPTARTGYAG